MQTRFLTMAIGWVLLLTMGFLPSTAQAVQTLSENEMDGVIAGFLDADVSAKLTFNTAATSNSGDGGLSLSGTTGGNDGIASVPINNSLVVEGVGREGGKGGGAAVSHNFANTTMDNSDNSDNRNQIQVDADGDSAAAFGIGSTAIQKGAPQVERDKPPDQPPGTTIPITLPGANVGGSPQRTGLITKWEAKEKSNGNKGSVRDANEESEASSDEALALSNEAQKDADALFLANSTRGQVGSGSNFTSEVNTSKATGLIGHLNFSSGVQARDQVVLNFSEASATTRTVSLTPVSSATAVPFTVRNFTTTDTTTGQ